MSNISEKFDQLKVNGTATMFDSFFTSLNALLLFLLRGGLLLVQLHVTPSNNKSYVSLQHLLDICINTMTYLSFGYIISFGKDLSGWFGTGISLDDNRIYMKDALFGLFIILSISGIITLTSGERLSLLGSAILNFCFLGLVIPVLIHLTHGGGWMSNRDWSGKKMAFIDHQGSTIIHLVGGYTSLLLCLVLGRRICLLREIEELDENGGFGYTCIIISFIGFNITSAPQETDIHGSILINFVMAASCSTLINILLTFIFVRGPVSKWIIISLCQSGLSGVVAVSPGVNLFSPMTAGVIGLLSGIVFHFTSKLIDFLYLEDFGNVITTHFVSGLLGSLYASLFFSAIRIDKLKDFAWQLLCNIVLLGIISFLALLLWAMDVIHVLRNVHEETNNKRAIILTKGKKTGCCKRLLAKQKDAGVSVEITPQLKYSIVPQHV